MGSQTQMMLSSFAWGLHLVPMSLLVSQARMYSLLFCLLTHPSCPHVPGVPMTRP